MKSIVILLDSLNRHFLPIYGNDWVKTPNIDRLASMGVTFDNHWLGSAPCMPARRDMFTGRLGFLERGWGGQEPFDITLQQMLKKAGIHSHIETDHQHYWNGGGEFYHTSFTSWNGHRGQEIDNCPGPVTGPERPEHLGGWKPQYAINRLAFKKESDFPSPRTFQGAIDWLQLNENEDNYLLWVEAFDPHESFDVPKEYLREYNDTWDGPCYIGSGYERVDKHPPEATEHLRKQYAACLTMTDRWLGKLLDEIERQNGFEDTLIIFTTDHGHLLGEHGVTGKNKWHFWNELSHIPMIAHLPGSAHAGERRSQMTQNIDLMPTLLEHFGIPLEHPIHGRSFLQCIHDSEAPAPRDTALYGEFAKTVNITDGKHTYLRAPRSRDNQPCYRYFLMPTQYHSLFPIESFQNAELGRFLPYVDGPVLRTPCTPSFGVDDEQFENRLYNIETDYSQTENLCGSPTEETMIDLLKTKLAEIDCPPEQFERLGLNA